MKLLLIGNGRWGKNYVLTIARDFPKISLIIATRENWRSLISDRPDGVIIATHPDSHIEIAEYALERNIPVMVEKPLALSWNEIKVLDKYSTPILVNYQHLFSPTFSKLKEIVSHWAQIDRIITRGYGDGPFREYSSLFDYGSHDLSMCFALITGRVEIDSITQTPSWYSSGDIFDLHLNIGGVRIFSQIGNGAQNKSRYFEIFGGKDVVVYDDMSENKLLHNEQKVEITDKTLPLTASIGTFLQLIGGKKDWRSGLELSNAIVSTLEQAFLSLHGEYKKTQSLVGDE